MLKKTFTYLCLLVCSVSLVGCTCLIPGAIFLGKLSKLKESTLYSRLDETDSLGGIDANNDGIRDDIESWIDEVASSSDERFALRFCAYAFRQTLLIDPSDLEKVRENQKLLVWSISCAGRTYREKRDSMQGKTGPGSYDYLSIIEVANANTCERVDRYAAYEDSVGSAGATNPLSGDEDKGDPCARGIGLFPN